MATSARKDVLFVVSIDTEEEWDWEGPFPEQNCSVSNIQNVPKFHRFLSDCGVRPTYFVDYAVASMPEAAKTLKSVLDIGDSELGAHLHPWCNPPYTGETGEFESHVVNLPRQLVADKLDELMAKLLTEFGSSPKSFRTGRWGIDGKVLELLIERGIEVDSSVYPFYRNSYFSCFPSPTDAYWPNVANPLQPGSQRDIMELPVSVGFNRSNYELCERIHHRLSNSAFGKLRFIGFLWHLKLLRKLYLTPELCNGAEMVNLCDSLLSKDQPVLHMYLHSSSLIKGQTGLMEADLGFKTICERIKQVLDHLNKKANVNFCTVSEAASILRTRNGQGALLR
ncbi:polysaccharide deacetylase family protein [Neiella sp. HB171785]|uniref:Polysaccharide deacetylase family protein n=1 Tax=Neiella litorisoli TaxID=2771431 RepID=A0A8J6QVI2_9GAMM|nr:polysaccharide deacetylase family protein [Neiella litorisoli]MBD1390538.1 polysaccharide deacetylase family protein [Neiella litorisoli]